MQSIDDRFWSKVDPNGVCWEWTGSLFSNGYGYFHISGSSKNPPRVVALAHRWAYQSLVGEIPEGLVIDHLCRNVRCVNPDHVEPVTQSENVRRGNGPRAGGLASKRKAEARVYCKNGHRWSENTYIRKDGGRQCRECHRENMQRRRDLEFSERKRDLLERSGR